MNPRGSIFAHITKTGRRHINTEFTKKIDQRENGRIESFIAQVLLQTRNILYNNMQSLKVFYTISATFRRPVGVYKGHAPKYAYDNFSTEVPAYTINNNQDAAHSIAQLHQYMINLENNLQGSGWVFVNYNYVLIRCIRVKLMGRRYISTPKELESMVINFKNTDSFCFKYAIITGLINLQNSKKKKKHQVNLSTITFEELNLYSIEHKLNWENIFTDDGVGVGIQQLELFQTNNPSISINIYKLDEDNNDFLHPYYISKVQNVYDETMFHLNLLLLTNNIDEHFVCIRDISKIAHCYNEYVQKHFICEKCNQHFATQEIKKEHYKKLMQEEKKFKRDRNKFMIILKKALKEIRGLF